MVRKTFKVSPAIIWLSSLFLGVIASVPKIAERHFNPMETLLNSGLTFLFSLFVWYYNIYTMPRFSAKEGRREFSVARLLVSLVVGTVVMYILAYCQQLLLSYLEFGPVMLMVEVRGILINLMFFMFLHLLYQSYHNEQVAVELERMKTDNLGAQYELLKNQINPHFLFNSLNTLKSMAETGDKHTVDFILKLSDFYRYTLESRKSDLIHLSDEIEIIEAYMFLLKARFEEAIDLSNDIDQQYYDTWVPPFTLQLLIENCVKHNVVSRSNPLRIRIYVEGNNIVIENPIQLKKTPDTSTGVGLENINQRYLHLRDQKVTIDASNNIFKVKLPLIHENYNY